MNLFNDQLLYKTREVRSQFMDHKLAIEASIALMDDGVQIPIQFCLVDELVLIPDHILTGGIGKWRIFFGDELAGIAASHNSWEQGSVMIKHYHTLYDEYIYVVRGKLKDRITGDIIMTPETAQQLQVPPSENIHGWYHIPAGQEHLIVALEDSEFVVKFVRQPASNIPNLTGN